MRASKTWAQGLGLHFRKAFDVIHKTSKLAEPHVDMSPEPDTLQNP